MIWRDDLADPTAIADDPTKPKAPLATTGLGAAQASGQATTGAAGALPLATPQAAPQIAPADPAALPIAKPDAQTPAPQPPRENAPPSFATQTPAPSSAPSPYNTPDPLAFVSLPQATTQMTAFAPAPSSPAPVLQYAPDAAPSPDAQPNAPAQLPASGTPAPPPAGGGGSGSKIYMGDPTRPGSGYIDWNGRSYRIEGTTAAGQGREPAAQDQYILEGGVLGPYVDPADYSAWVNSQHAANTVTPPAPGAPATPAPAASPATDPNGMPTSAMTPGWEGGTPTPPTPINGQPVTPSTPVATPQGWEGPGGPAPTPFPSSPATDPNGMPTGGSGAPPAPPAPPPVNVPTPTQATTTGANGMPTAAPALPTLSPTTPNNSLTNSTITPGPSVDRYAIAKSKLDSLIHDQLDPQFAADNRDTIRAAAAAGAIGQGSVQTSLGDILARRTHDINSASTGFLNDALTGSIDDARFNIGVAQQQQLFQKSQSDTAFDQQLQLQKVTDSELGQQWTQYMQAIGFNADQIQQAFQNAMSVQRLSDDETGAAFNRALQQFIAGNSGDPASVLEWLAGQYAHPTTAAA